jgi:hypothetical protein
MESGNIAPKTTIIMDYCTCSEPPFHRSVNEIKLIINPHQTKSLDNPHNTYMPLNYNCKTVEIDCSCVKSSPKLFDSKFDELDGSPTLFWIDPSGLQSECIASIIANWKDHITTGKNIALGIVIPEGDTTQKVGDPYELWRVDAFGFSYVTKSSIPVWWYPALSRDNQSLEQAARDLDPYDVFPLVEFPNRSIEWGERTLSGHYHMLEMVRTRTRNIIYLDSLCPDQAFDQFYRTLKAIPSPSFSISRPVLTPGGSTNGFMTTLLAGALTESHFLTPKNEIPISSNAKTQGIMILRKCT